MFKRLSLAAIVLAACSGQTSTPPRVVKFDDVFVGYPSIENGCEWQNVQVSVFNQKDQKVSFQHKYCHPKEQFIKAHYQEGKRAGDHWVFSTIRRPIPDASNYLSQTNSLQDVIQPIFSIEKLGPLTPQEFLGIRVFDNIGLSAASCHIVNEGGYLWRIAPFDKVADKRDNQDRSKYKASCELLGFQHFGIKDGLVISYPAAPYANGYLDPASITYTNKG